MSRSMLRRIRRSTHAGGAGESGLAKVIELQAVNMFGDALVTISLAHTLFFASPLGQARGKVALYLLITMAPFAVVAPVIGPLLDRIGHGRRWALAGAMLARAFFAWMMADSVGGGPLLYTAAFGSLVASKAHGVLRAALVPRVVPKSTTLVRANARVSLLGTVAMLVAGPVGAGVGWFGAQWSLRLAFLVYILGMVLALRLPKRVDSPVIVAGQADARDRESLGQLARLAKQQLNSVGSSVVPALRANLAIRAFSGFLITFLAFLLRSHPIGSMSSTAMYAIVAGAAGVGSLIGTAVGSRLRARVPEVVIVVVLLLETLAVTSSGIWYGVVTVTCVALMAGVAQALAKLALDSLIQRDIPSEITASVFARCETVLQLAWVVGGLVGILLPLKGKVGLAVAAACLLGGLALVILGMIRARAQRVSVRRERARAGVT